jgi:hypothetical protein
MAEIRMGMRMTGSYSVARSYPPVEGGGTF